MNKIIQSNLNAGRIFIYGDITEKTAHRFAQKLRYLVLEQKKKRVILYLHSCGGEFDAGTAIVDDIVAYTKSGVEIIGIGIGKVFSAAADILCMCSTRYLTPNGIIYLHPMQASAESDSVHNVKMDIDFYRKQYKQLAEQEAKRCGYKTKVKIEEFIEIMDKNTWLMARDAIKLKIIDGIYDYSLELNNV